MKLKLADVLEAKDLDLGASSWFRVDQERISQFAEATEDRQWIHVDVERAKQSDFGGPIAHGFLILSLLPKLFFEVVTFEDMERMINYGIDKVRFISPVPAGAEIHLRVKLASAQRRLGGVLMRIRGEIYVRDSGRRALVTEMLFLAFPKADA